MRTTATVFHYVPPGACHHYFYSPILLRLLVVQQVGQRGKGLELDAFRRVAAHGSDVQTIATKNSN